MIKNLNTYRLYDNFGILEAFTFKSWSAEMKIQAFQSCILLKLSFETGRKRIGGLPCLIKSKKCCDFENCIQLFKVEWNRLNSRPDLHTTASDKPSFIQSMKSSPAAYKPMIILLVLMLLQQLSGAYPTISYALPIIKSIAADDDKTVSQVASLEILGAIR